MSTTLLKAQLRRSLKTTAEARGAVEAALDGMLAGQAAASRARLYDPVAHLLEAVGRVVAELEGDGTSRQPLERRRFILASVLKVPMLNVIEAREVK